MADLSAVILTLDEEQNLPACLESLRPLGCEVFVVDSGSTDRTTAIAEAAGARVVYHEFESQAQQLNWALKEIDFERSWVLRLDADERLSSELAEELSDRLPEAADGVNGFYVRRREHFMGRWIRHGGYYPTWLLRVWRRGRAVSEDRVMDEHMVLASGRADFLRHDIIEDNRKGLAHWIDRHNRYARREAHAIVHGGSGREIHATPFGNPEQRRRWLRVRVYQRLPMFIRPFLYFVYRYVVRMGFLDGTRGLVFHFLQGLWYRLLVDAYILESRVRSRAGGESMAAKRKVANGRSGGDSPA